MAVALGGRLGAHSAAGSYGIWRGLDSAVHVSWNPHGNVAKPGRELSGFPANRTITSHWRVDGFDDGSDPWRESVQQALAQIISCSREIDILCACDSAMNLGLLSFFELSEIFSRAPARVRSLGAEVDGSADSGLETIVRVWARRRGHRVRTQVSLGGHPVDLLIDDSLVVEPGGRGYHSDDETFEKDHVSSSRLQTHGFTVYKPTYQMIMFTWTQVEAALEFLIQQGRNRDPATWF